MSEPGNKPRLWGPLGRALLLRCPRCGGRGILRGWFALKERCPTCGLVFDRGESEDYWFGGYTINWVVSETVAAIFGVALLLATRPNVRWGLVLWGGLAAAVALPILFFPFSRTVWLALDLWARPALRGDRLTQRAP